MIVTTVEHRWYAIQTTSGHENKVRSLIQRRIDADPRPAEERAIRQALVPTQEAVEIKNGKKVIAGRSVRDKREAEWLAITMNNRRNTQAQKPTASQVSSCSKSSASAFHSTAVGATHAPGSTVGEPPSCSTSNNATPPK